MNKFIVAFFLFLSISFSSFAGGSKIIAYFNKPVNTAFSHGTNAVCVNNNIGDTLVNYINRAKYSLDIAIYQLSQTSGMANVVGALNAAQARGVVIRVIYDGKDNASTSISSLNTGIARLASPSGSNYNIMHNKFMIIDANSTNAADAIVWTGSFNWSQLMFTGDYNNAIIIQDQPLAQAYVAEFNQMWGSSTTTPNSTLSKFGPYKTATTAHNFTVDGHLVELYFSPSDGTNNQIINAIQSADKELFFGVYTFTESPNATDIGVKYNTSGYTVKGIMDHYSVGYAAATTLTPIMGNDLKIYSGSGTVYHNKMMIVDPDYPGKDPLVVTGSHNWSATADTKNDENLLIIHDSTTANVYLQSFAQNFIDMGGSITPVPYGTTGVETIDESLFSIYPNPTNGILSIRTSAGQDELHMILTDLSGKQIMSRELKADETTDISLSHLEAGVYLVKIASVQGMKVQKVIKL